MSLLSLFQQNLQAGNTTKEFVVSIDNDTSLNVVLKRVRRSPGVIVDVTNETVTNFKRIRRLPSVSSNDTDISISVLAKIKLFTSNLGSTFNMTALLAYVASLESYNLTALWDKVTTSHNIIIKESINVQKDLTTSIDVHLNKD